MTSERTIKVAIVQPALELGAVERNLERIDRLLRDAHRVHEPDLILLPESMTTPNVYDRRMRDVARPVDGQPFQLLTRAARELGCVIGGGFVAVRGRDTYGTYVLAEPDGSAHLHDKDIPTVWEHNYYRGGNDDGYWRQTSLGPLGCACGWEWARFRTARRLRGRVGLMVGGMCWPSFPFWPAPIDRLWARERAIQRQLARELPGQMARLLGCAVAMPSHVGDVAFDTPLVPGLPWRTEMVGESQICERDGTVLARLSYEDGEGHAAATVRIAAPEPLDPLADRFWIPVMPATIHAVWHPLNLHGAAKYRLMRATRRHPWQRLPLGADLPDEIGPGDPAESAMALSR